MNNNYLNNTNSSQNTNETVVNIIDISSNDLNPTQTTDNILVNIFDISSNEINPTQNTNETVVNIVDNNSNKINQTHDTNETVVNIVDNNSNEINQVEIMNTDFNKSKNQKKKEQILDKYIKKRRDYVNSTINNNNTIESFVNILFINTHSFKNIISYIIEYIGIILEFVAKSILKGLEIGFTLIPLAFQLISHSILNAIPELLAIIVYVFQSYHYKLDNPKITNGIISFISSYGLLLSKGAIKINVSKYPELTTRKSIIIHKILLSLVYLGKITEIGLEIWYATLFNKTYSYNITYNVLCSVLPIFTTLYYVLMPHYLKNYCNYIELLGYYNLNDKVNLLNNKIDNMLLTSGNIVDESFVKFTEYNEHKCENDECNECICSICYTKESKNKILTKCNHIYDTECIDKWLHTDIIKNNELTCPMCRADLFEYNDKNSKDINAVLNNV
jgi:hypothetical protein